MAWIEIHQALANNHRKVLYLQELLDIEEPTAIGHLVCLWLWAIDNAPNGVLPPMRITICKAAKWAGSISKFVDALVVSEWLDRVGDSLVIHDYEEYIGKLVESRRRDAERKKLEYWKNKGGAGSGRPPRNPAPSAPAHPALPLEDPRRQHPQEPAPAPVLPAQPIDAAAFPHLAALDAEVRKYSVHGAAPATVRGEIRRAAEDNLQDLARACGELGRDWVQEMTLRLRRAKVTASLRTTSCPTVILSAQAEYALRDLRDDLEKFRHANNNTNGNERSEFFDQLTAGDSADMRRIIFGDGLPDEDRGG